MSRNRNHLLRSGVAAIGVVVVGIAGVACSDDGATAVTHGVRPIPNYETPAALVEASEVVAVVEVTKETFRGEIREHPRAVFEARVIDGIKNAVNGQKLRITQAVNTSKHRWGDEIMAEYRPGRRYLVFLREYFPGAQAGGDPLLAGLYGALDGVAAYDENPDARYSILPGAGDPPGGKIPRVVTRAEL